MAWKTAVSAVASLPAVGNTTDDLRIALDTGIIYRWNGSAWINEGARAFIYSNPTGGGSNDNVDGGAAASVYGGTTDIDGGHA